MSGDSPGARLKRPQPVQVLEGDGGPAVPALVARDGRAWAVVWPGMGAQLRSMHRVSLGEGGQTPVLRHPAEAAYYVIEGRGEVEDIDAGTVEPLAEGSMVHVEAETAYLVRGVSPGIELVGGPSPADPGLYGDGTL